MYRVPLEVNDRAPLWQSHKQEQCHADPKKAAQETRGLKVSNREASNRVVEATRSNPVKDYSLIKYP